MYELQYVIKSIFTGYGDALVYNADLTFLLQSSSKGKYSR